LIFYNPASRKPDPTQSKVFYQNQNAVANLSSPFSTTFLFYYYRG
jgi:hypothetical protein